MTYNVRVPLCVPVKRKLATFINMIDETSEAILARHPDTLIHEAVAFIEVKAEIIENYMPPFPRADTKPITAIRCGEWFLRYSKGPKTGSFWDMYGEDYQSVELAREELVKAPPVPTHKPYLEFKLPMRDKA
jgi:hypothetical protein